MRHSEEILFFFNFILCYNILDNSYEMVDPESRVVQKPSIYTRLRMQHSDRSIYVNVEGNFGGKYLK